LKSNNSKKIIENELKLIADSKRWMGEWVLIAVHEKYFLLITCKWIYEIAISISGINLSNIKIISPRLYPSPFFRSKIVYGKDSINHQISFIIHLFLISYIFIIISANGPTRCPIIISYLLTLWMRFS
jgi:hypothetical protein